MDIAMEQLFLKNLLLFCKESVNNMDATNSKNSRASLLKNQNSAFLGGINVLYSTGIIRKYSIL